ncbi:MAG: PorT family protein [Prevotella sp.]|nr:PorT family protein [Prevotella sp.]
MKKLLTFLFIVAMATPSFAQFETNRQRSRYNHNDTERYYGLRLGLNSSALNSDKIDIDMNARTGVSVGGVYGMQLANSTPIWLEAGLFYSEKGGKTQDDNGDQVKCRLTYFEVPVVIKYAFDIADDLYLQPFLGGYVALGIAGKMKEYGTRFSDSSYNYVNRPDAGLRLGCGLEYQMVYAEVGFDFGLANIGKDDFDSVRTQTLFINIGVNF